MSARLLDLLRSPLTVPRVPITRDNTVESVQAFPKLPDTMRVVANNARTIAADYLWRQWNLTPQRDRPSFDQFGCVAPTHRLTWIEGKTPAQIYVDNKLSANNFCAATGALVLNLRGSDAFDIWNAAVQFAKLDDEVLTAVRGLGMSAAGLNVITWFAKWRGNACIGPMATMLAPLSDKGHVMPYAIAITGTERTTQVAESWAIEGAGPVFASLALMNSEKGLVESIGRGGRDNGTINRARELRGGAPVTPFDRLTWNPPESAVHSFGEDAWLPVGDDWDLQTAPGPTDDIVRAIERIRDGIYPNIGAMRATVFEWP